MELRTDNPNTRIDRISGGVPGTVCFAPCRRILDRNSIYIIRGEGVRQTSQFLLPDDRPHVMLDVEAGSSSRRAGGIALLIGGGLLSYIGMLTWGSGQAAGTFSMDPYYTEKGREERNRGLIMMAVGVPALVLGTYWILTTRTRVTSSTGAVFSDAPPVVRRPRAPRFALTSRGLEF